MPQITIKRDFNLMGYFKKFTVLLDDQKIGMVSSQKALTLDLPEGKYVLRLKSFYFKSNVINLDAQREEPKAFCCGYTAFSVVGSVISLLVMLMFLMMYIFNIEVAHSLRYDHSAANYLKLALLLVLFLMSVGNLFWLSKPGNGLYLQPIDPAV